MTTSFFRVSTHFIARFFLATIIAAASLSSCNKADVRQNNSNQVATYNSEVLDKWITMELRLMRNATGIPNQAFSRHYVYSGIAALESLAPGLPAHAAWSRKWNGLTGLPMADHSIRYYYPANLNGAMATITRALFPNATNADKLAIDSLETALTQEFLLTQNQSIIDASANFGKSVATAIFYWSETDGYKNANSAYTAPVGDGLWVPTAPGFANPSTPYWCNNRTVIRGSIDNTQPMAPPAYSTDPGSDFYQMVKQVYDVSQSLTTEQKNMAMFWRDVPGATSPGHWLSIVQQTIRKTHVSLDKAALAYALTGAAINDALISCWKIKYQYSMVRPITYIRNVLGHTSWLSYLTTPPHPEYPSAHAVLSVAAAEVMEKLFGNIGSFTDHTYDYLGFNARTYSSFTAIGNEAAQSRLYAGIHYQPSINAGIGQGKKVAANIFKKQGGLND